MKRCFIWELHCVPKKVRVEIKGTLGFEVTESAFEWVHVRVAGPVITEQILPENKIYRYHPFQKRN